MAIPDVSAGGYAVPAYRPPVWVAPEDMPGPTNVQAEAQSAVSHGGPPAHAVEAAAAAETGKEPEGLAPAPATDGAERPGFARHHSVREVMTPHLQFMAGPMLVYHTVHNNVWHGAGASLCASRARRACASHQR